MIIACVKTGSKYGPEYVHKLVSMIDRHLKIPYEFVCLTDRPREVECNTDDISGYHLDGWWGKMALFEPSWRKGERIIYFDLDMVVCGDLLPLANLDIDFGICGNFTRAAGNKKWPCAYGSCVMTIGPGACEDIWHSFNANAQTMIKSAGGFGDQKIIEELKPDATILQEVLPEGFFLGYRDLDYHKPSNCSVVAFAGSSKPHNCQHEWIKEEWN